MATIDATPSGNGAPGGEIAPSYRNYVLALLFVGYVLNAVDRVGDRAADLVGRPRARRTDRLAEPLFPEHLTLREDWLPLLPAAVAR